VSYDLLMAEPVELLAARRRHLRMLAAVNAGLAFGACERLQVRLRARCAEIAAELRLVELAADRRGLGGVL
jgi:hypothetical protein